MPNNQYITLKPTSSADSMGHVPRPHFYKWLGTGGTVSKRTENKKLAKLY